MHAHHHHQTSLVILSIVIAIFASYTALDLVSSISSSKGRIKWLWLIGGSLAMGIGIWSMHFIGMLAFRLPGLDIYYDIPLLVLSIVVAVMASALALYLIANRNPSMATYATGSLVMGAAISGMHYIGIASMRLAASISWNLLLVLLSILIAFAASYVALFVAFKLRSNVSIKGFMYRGLGGFILGFAIAGMHYTGMAAMSFTHLDSFVIPKNQLLATDALAAIIIIATLVILGIALSGTNVDRALSRKTLINEFLQQGIKARDEFVSLASHELRTPLTSIKLQIELTVRYIQSPQIEKSKVISLLSQCDQNLERLNRLVEDMLDISRISTGKLRLQKATFDLSQLVADVLERFQNLLHDANCELKFTYPKQAINGNWDRFRIEQVLVNLIGNAAKYAPGKPVVVELSVDENHAQLSVTDHGNGIALEDQERIFQRFERIANLDSDSHSGLGLGLYIVKEIVHMHGGSILVQSELGSGAQFLVRLPLES